MGAAAPVRLATRRSAQASTQAGIVAELIAARCGRATELVYIDTTGDQRGDVPLHTIGGQGVFVKEVQQAVLDGRADVAVHSAKDVPTTAVEGLTIAAYCRRRDPRDALIGRGLAELGEGATIATGSVRRRAQLALRRPDLHFTELRGNIHTRLDKLPAGGSIVMAVAALEILGLTERIAEVLDIERCVPAPGQGCVVVECRTADADIRAAVTALDHPPTRRAVEIERAFLGAFGTGCSLPIGAHVAGEQLHVFVGERPDPWRTVRLGQQPTAQAVTLAAELGAETGG